MDDVDSLKLLTEILENVKKTTAKFPHEFFLVYSYLISDIGNISAHIKNKNLRICYMYLFTLYSPLFDSCNNILRIKINDELKDLLEEEKLDEGLKEVILSASKALTVKVLGDDIGRNIINIQQLKTDLVGELAEEDETTKTLILSRIANSIRRVYDNFVKENSTEMIEFYDKLIDSSKTNWTSVYDAIVDYTLERDNKAILWKRGEME